MRILLFCVIMVVAPLLPGTAQTKPKKCNHNEFALQYRAMSVRGIYNYWEAYPGSSHSPVLIEHFDTNDDLRWTARAERGCSQGVGRCWLMLDTASDGVVDGGQMRIEMNYFETGDRRYMLLSQLWENIVYAYFKTNPFSPHSPSNPLILLSRL